MMTPSDDYDGPWKETLEAYLPEIIAFFFPETYRDIAWERNYQWMDKELNRSRRTTNAEARRSISS
ncbi:MAG: hypothetical protein U0232_21800 [Thermomicrobiales bacterium]